MMSADNQAESVFERNRLSAIAKIKQESRLARPDRLAVAEAHRG
jgi:hypothetical protein